MVTPALRQVFENEGVGLIPLLAGAEYLVKEISTPAGGAVEIVILGPAPGGEGAGSQIDQTMADETPALRDAAGNKPALLAFERVVDVESHPFLKSHVMKGHAVLPMAVIAEWLAHGAIHENPGLTFLGFDDLRIFKGVKVAVGEKVTLQVLTAAAASRDGCEHVLAEMRSGNVLHARATIVLGAKLPVGRPEAMVLLEKQKYSVADKDIYTCGRLFHGADLQAIQKIEGYSATEIAASVSPAPQPAAWMKKPLRSGWLGDPLAMDAAFQLMILWSFETHGSGSLPTSAGAYRQYGPFPSSPMRILIRAAKTGSGAAEATIDFVDASGKLVARMERYECVMDKTLAQSFAGNQLAGA